MTAITTLGVDNLSLRGAGTEYNLITRLFTTKAEADAALALGAASGGWVPTAGKTNVCITADEGILTYDFNTSALVNADSATRTYADTLTRINMQNDFPTLVSKCEMTATTLLF